LPLAERLTAIRSKALNETTHLFKRKLKSIADYNQAKQNYLSSKRVLVTIQEELEQQRNQLASAMAISPDTCIDGGFQVIGCISAPAFCDSIPNMEMASVNNRPEYCEAGLNYLNSEQDVKRAIVKLLPKMTGFWKYTYDQNKFLLNKDWDEVGLRFNFDLVDWLANLDESNAAKSKALKAEKEIGTVALMIASQVRKAALKYFRAKKEYENRYEALDISNKFLQKAKIRAESDDLTKLELLEAKAENVQVQIECLRSLGEAKAALAKLHAAIGTNYTEPPPKSK
jgi:outer membrane protein TolC